MKENGGNGASTLGDVTRHNNDSSVATLQEDTVGDSASLVDVEVFLAQEIDVDVLHQHSHLQQSNETLASQLSESSLNAQGLQSEASPTTSPQPQIPHLEVVETTDPFVATGVPNNDTEISPPVEDNDFVAAPDDGNEDEGGLTTLDGQTLLASARGLPGCDSREGPFSKHKREDFQRGTHDRRTSKERISRTADTENGRREFLSKYEEDYKFVDRLSDLSWTAVRDETSSLEEFSLGTTGTAGVSRSGRSTEPLDYSEVEQVDSLVLPRKLHAPDNTPGASRLDALLSTKARLPAGSEASCGSNEADWESLKLNMSDSGASTIFRSNDSCSLELPRATTATRNSLNEADINKKDKTDVVVGGKGKDDADPDANVPVPNDIHKVAVTDPSNDYEIIPLMNRARTGSDVSSQSGGNLSLGGRELVDAVFDHELDLTGHSGGGSGFVTGFQNSGSQISVVSGFGSSGNPSTQTSSRFAPQSKDMLRLRGGRGRGQGRLDVVAEAREISFDIRIDPFNGKDESPELESLGLTSASSTVGRRQDNLASGDNNEDQLFVGNKQEDLRNFVRRVGKTGDIRLIVQIMEEHADSASVQEEACSVLAQLAVMCKTETTILEAGVARAILGAMKQHESVAKIQELGCSALHSLAYANGRNVKKIAEDGGVWVILRGMKQHQSIADVQLQGCWALSNLASHDENRKLIAANGGIGVILLSMEQHQWAPGVQQWVCRLLSNLALNHENEREIGRAGGIALVLLAMKQHQLIVGVQESACRALSKLAFDGENQEKIKEAEGIRVILCAMDQHQLAPDVQEQGCRALSQLALHGENRKEIGEAGGIGVILRAMENHQRVPDVQAQTCRALSILAENDDNKKEVGDAGGIDMILCALEQHRSVLGVQNQACRALFHLGIADGNRKTTREADSGGIVVFLRAMRFHWRDWDASRGVALVLDAMKEHPRVPDVQEEGCRALSDLAINHVGKTAVGDAGGIGAIIRAMKEHLMVSKIQEQACQALSILAEYDDSTRQLGKAGGIDVILRAMEQHQLVPGLQKQACRALSLWAIDDDNRKMITKADPERIIVFLRAMRFHWLGWDASSEIRVVLDAMKQHLRAPVVQEEGCRAISDLADIDDSSKTTVGDAGGIGAIIRAMKEHHMVPKVQEQACRALSILAANCHNNKKICKAGGIDVALRAMEQHQLVPGVQEKACRVLSHLAIDDEVWKAIGEDAHERIVVLLRAMRFHWRGWDASRGIAVVLDAMTQHTRVPDVQEEGCRALSLFGVNDVGKTTVGDAGGIRVIIRAMKEHHMVSKVQQQACRALSILAEDDVNKKKVGKAGGIDVILRAMEQHQFVPVQKQACQVLFHLGIDDENRKMIIEADSGGLVVFLRAMRFHWRDWDASRGIALVLDAMKEHPQVPDVQQEGCRALSNVASTDVGKTTVGDAGAIRAIIRAMKEHQMVSKVQEQACRALSVLAENDDNKKKVGKAGGIDAILRAMEQHQFVPGVQERACYVLFELAMDDENRKKIRDAGVIGVILRAMEEHSLEEDSLEEGVPKSCLMVLSKLSEDDENKMMMREDGGVAVILRTMENCAGDWEVERLGFELLERLGQPP